MCVKNIYKVLSYHVNVIDIFVCYTHDNFQDNNHLNVC